MSRDKDIRGRHAAGQSVSEIASDLGVSRSTVYRALGSDAPRKGSRSGHAVLNVRLSDLELAAFDRAVAEHRVRRHKGTRGPTEIFVGS